jgi:hypothetical protein
MATNKLFIVALSCLLMGILITLGILGLGVSKWLHNVGSVALVIAFAVLIALPFVQAARGVLPSYHPFAIAMPTLTLLSLNIFGKLAVGALSGFEYVAVLAGECRNPEKTIGWSTLIAAPIIAVMFILGTSAVLAFSTPAQVDLIAPIPQTIRRGLGSLGAATIVGPIVILMLTSRSMANSSIGVVHPARPPISDTGELDRLRWRGVARVRTRRYCWSRRAGGVSAARQCSGHSLWAHVSGALCVAVRRGATRSGVMARSEVAAQAGRRRRAGDDTVVRHAVSLPDHRRTELADVRDEDLHRRARPERAWLSRVRSRGSAA